MAPKPLMYFLHKTFPGNSDKTYHCAKFHSFSCLISVLPKTDLCETTECSPSLKCSQNFKIPLTPNWRKKVLSRWSHGEVKEGCFLPHCYAWDYRGISGWTKQQTVVKPRPDLIKPHQPQAARNGNSWLLSGPKLIGSDRNVQMSRCPDVQIIRCRDVQMSRCPDV